MKGRPRKGEDSKNNTKGEKKSRKKKVSKKRGIMSSKKRVKRV